METFDFLIELFVILCIVAVLGIGITFFIISAARKQKAQKVASGKHVLEDRELLAMSVERLQTFDREDLFWLLDYAAMMKNQAIIKNKTQEAICWDNLMERVDTAIERACL